MTLSAPVVSIVSLGLVLASTGCSSAVNLSGGRYAPLRDSDPVAVIDADGLDRHELESVLQGYVIVQRFHEPVGSESRFRADVAASLEGWKVKARRAGGETILYTRHSEMVAVIMQNTRYAAPTGTVAVYVLRRRGRG